MYELLRELCKYDTQGRGEIVLEKLLDLGVSPEIQSFEYGGKKYKNIIARFRNGSPNHEIAVSAHYDKVGFGQGAVDDGAAVVELLGCLEELVKNPKNIDFSFIFFDGEEEYNTGSKYFVNKNDRKFDGAYNLEVTGFGNAIMIGGLSFSLDTNLWVPNDEKLNSRIKKLCKKESIPYYLVNTPCCDNVILNFEGIPATVIATLPEEVGKMWQEDGTFSKRVMETMKINGPQDVFENIEPATLDMMKNFLLKLADSYEKESK